MHAPHHLEGASRQPVTEWGIWHDVLPPLAECHPAICYVYSIQSIWCISLNNIYRLHLNMYRLYIGLGSGRILKYYVYHREVSSSPPPVGPNTIPYCNRPSAVPVDPLCFLRCFCISTLAFFFSAGIFFFFFFFSLWYHPHSLILSLSSLSQRHLSFSLISFSFCPFLFFFCILYIKPTIRQPSSPLVLRIPLVAACPWYHIPDLIA